VKVQEQATINVIFNPYMIVYEMQMQKEAQTPSTQYSAMSINDYESIGRVESEPEFGIFSYGDKSIYTQNSSNSKENNSSELNDINFDPNSNDSFQFLKSRLGFQQYPEQTLSPASQNINLGSTMPILGSNPIIPSTRLKIFTNIPNITNACPENLCTNIKGLKPSEVDFKVKYKTETCKFWDLNGVCKFGDNVSISLLTLLVRLCSWLHRIKK